MAASWAFAGEAISTSLPLSYAHGRQCRPNLPSCCGGLEWVAPKANLGGYRAS